ncbi:hypothetical protein GCM10008164_28290 [Achromobacter xylosoxidans]|nr:hypothetical protein GCM10008164_28290 [Achromobacter xylosoxidans]
MAGALATASASAATMAIRPENRFMILLLIRPGSRRNARSGPIVLLYRLAAFIKCLKRYGDFN